MAILTRASVWPQRGRVSSPGALAMVTSINWVDGQDRRPRRAFLRAILITAGGSLVAACGVPAPAPSPTAAPAKPTEAPKPTDAPKPTAPAMQPTAVKPAAPTT